MITFERPAFSHVRRTDIVNSPQVHFFAAPIDEGRSRILMKDFHTKFISMWIIHLAMNVAINADTWVHDVERSARIHTAGNMPKSLAVGAARTGRKISNGLNYMLASKSDLGTTSFRNWWMTYGYADAPPNTFGPASAASLPAHALSRAEQIDPWIHHTKHCSSCRRALVQLRIMQKVVIAGAATGAIMLQGEPSFAIASVLMGIYANNFLRKLATTIEGNTNREEIGDRSFSATH